MYRIDPSNLDEKMPLSIHFPFSLFFIKYKLLFKLIQIWFVYKHSSKLQIAIFLISFLSSFCIVTILQISAKWYQKCFTLTDMFLINCDAVTSHKKMVKTDLFSSPLSSSISCFSFVSSFVFKETSRDVVTYRMKCGRTDTTLVEYLPGRISVGSLLFLYIDRTVCLKKKKKTDRKNKKTAAASATKGSGHEK